jgi:hypothetical protein
MSNDSKQIVEEEIEELFKTKNTITKEELKKFFDEFRKSHSRHGRGRGGTNHAGPMHEEMRQKLAQLLETELNKINSNSITKEQAKAVLTSFGSQAKEQWHAQIDQYIQSSIKDELTKLNTQEVNGNQARDLLRNVCHKMRSAHSGGPAMLDDNMKNEFMNEFKSKHGTNKISADEVWELMKLFDKKQHDKMGCCQKNTEWDKVKDQKWDEIFNQQYKELFGDINKSKLNQQQLEELAKKIKEKLREDCPQHPGKRFCQH